MFFLCHDPAWTQDDAIRFFIDEEAFARFGEQESAFDAMVVLGDFELLQEHLMSMPDLFTYPHFKTWLTIRWEAGDSVLSTQEYTKWLRMYEGHEFPWLRAVEHEGNFAVSLADGLEEEPRTRVRVLFEVSPADAWVQGDGRVSEIISEVDPQAHLAFGEDEEVQSFWERTADNESWSVIDFEDVPLSLVRKLQAEIEGKSSKRTGQPGALREVGPALQIFKHTTAFSQWADPRGIEFLHIPEKKLIFDGDDVFSAPMTQAVEEALDEETLDLYRDGEADSQQRRLVENVIARERKVYAGWYWWWCQPGCMPDSDPYGPFETREEAVASAWNDIE